MSGLGDRIAAELGPRDLGTFDRQLSEVLAYAGSGRKAAALIGIGETTWRRWRAGATPRPKPMNIDRLHSAVFAARTARRAGRIDSIVIQATQRTRGREHGRPRRLDSENLRLMPGAGERVARVYWERGQEAAAAQFIREVQETRFYKPWLALGVLADWENQGYDPYIEDYEDMYDVTGGGDWDTDYGFDV